MSLREAISEPVFCAVFIPMAALFVAAVIRIARPFQKDTTHD